MFKMNIFVLHFNVIVCAMYHCDKHCVKLILEAMQLLCTAHCVLDGEVIQQISEKTGKPLKPKYSKPDERMYKATHINHPCSIWVRESSENYKWLYELFIALCDEYTYRYGKTHLCDKKFRGWMSKPPNNIPIGNMTPFRLAMPDECKVVGANTVESYRNYYRQEKSHIAKWKKREPPKWFFEVEVN